MTSFTDQFSTSNLVKNAFADIYRPQRGSVSVVGNRIVVFFDETQVQRDVPDSILVAVSDRVGVPVRDLIEHVR